MWKTLGEANFLFHPASGQTHFLNELAAWILTAIETRPQTEAEVTQSLLLAYKAQSTPEFRQSVHSTVQVLAGLGLIVDDQANS